MATDITPLGIIRGLVPRLDDEDKHKLLRDLQRELHDSGFLTTRKSKGGGGKAGPSFWLRHVANVDWEPLKHGKTLSTYNIEGEFTKATKVEVGEYYVLCDKTGEEPEYTLVQGDGSQGVLLNGGREVEGISTVMTGYSKPHFRRWFEDARDDLPGLAPMRGNRMEGIFLKLAQKDIGDRVEITKQDHGHAASDVSELVGSDDD